MTGTNGIENFGLAVRPNPPKVGEGLKRVHDAARAMYRWTTNTEMTAIDACLAVARSIHSKVPVWLVLLAPPSSGKTEILTCIEDAMNGDAFAFDKLTPASLVSGVVDKDGNANDLLPMLDEHLVLIKDMSPILTMDASARNAIIGDLRSIYDGSFTKVFAKRGVVRYNVTFPLLAAATSAWEHQYAVLGALGQRFVQIRMPFVEPLKPTESVSGRMKMRADLSEAIASYLDGCGAPNDLTKADTDRIFEACVHLATLRGDVPRDGTKSIIGEPVIESPYRLFRQLCVIGASSNVDTAIAVAMHGIPKVRSRTLDAIASGGIEGMTTDAIAANTKMSRTVTERQIEDLVMLGVASEIGPRPFRYYLTSNVKERRVN